MADRKKLRATLENIFAEVRLRRQESCRQGKGGGREEVAESESGIKRSWYDGTESGDERVGG